MTVRIDEHDRELPDRTETIMRGLRLRCPKCGKGPLLAGYLTPQESCSHCGESFAELRADDGPAWLTVLVTGHVVVPLMLLLIQNDVITDPFKQMAFAIGFAVLGVALLLPRAKGVFMALIWLFNQDEDKKGRKGR